MKRALQRLLDGRVIVRHTQQIGGGGARRVNTARVRAMTTRGSAAMGCQLSPVASSTGSVTMPASNSPL